MLVSMCRVCIDSYEMPHPRMRVYDGQCDCCQRQHITCFQLTGEQIDKFNEEAAAPAPH